VPAFGSGQDDGIALELGVADQENRRLRHAG
jgi:hypothetical protein